MSAWEGCVGQSDEWYTPKYIFDALGVEFDLDVAAPEGGPKHVPCAQWIDAEHDGLRSEWAGFVWMNPPFGARNGLEPWLNKFVHHRNGVALVPDRTSAPWFQKAVRYMDAVLFLAPKVQFERPDGSLGKSPSTGTSLLAMGKTGVSALYRAAPCLGILMLPEAA